MALPRRDFLALGLAAGASALLPGRAFATVATGTRLHGLSAFGDLKYPADFDHFAYVNPQAPKGGAMNFAPPNWGYNQSPLTFNTLKSFALKGDAPPRMEMCFDTLMERALDAPDAVYGLLAESVTLSADRNSFDFALRPAARWHDGSPLTAHDVAFSFMLYKEKGHPDLLLPLVELKEAVALDDHTVRLTFSGKQSVQAILTAVGMPIVSKAYYAANDFEASTMTPPLGSGPYKVGRVSAGEFIEYERVADYWGADLPVNRGQDNFGRIRIDFYRDRQAAFQAFKKGDTTFREEFVARVWATGYDFPALKQGKVSSASFPARNGRRCRRSPSTSAGSVFATYGCAVRWTCASISNGRSGPCSPVPTSVRNPISSARTSAPKACLRRRNWRFWSRSAPNCRPKCSASR